MASVNHDWLCWLSTGFLLRLNRLEVPQLFRTTQASVKLATLPLLHSCHRPVHLSVQLFGVLSLTEATFGGGATQTLLGRPAAAVEVLLRPTVRSEWLRLRMSLDQELKYGLDLFRLLLCDVFSNTNRI